MTPEQIVRKLKARFGDAIIEAVVEGKHPHVVVCPQQWRPIAQFLRDDPDLAFDALRCLSGVDYPPDHLVGVYSRNGSYPDDSYKEYLIIEWCNGSMDKRSTFHGHGLCYPGAGVDHRKDM